MDKENQNLHPNKRLRRESSENHYNIQGYNYDDSDYWPDSESDNGNLLKKNSYWWFCKHNLHKY